MLGIFSSEASPRRKQSLRGWILIAWLCVWTQRTAAQGPEVVTAAVRGTAALTAPVTADILIFFWYRGTAVSDAQLIISYFVAPPAQTPGPQFTGRESGSHDGTLHIRDLRTSDTGSYTVTVTLTTGATTTATRQLRVLEMDPTPRGSPYPTPRGRPYPTPTGSPYPTPTGGPCLTPCSCWLTTLGVACGVLLGAAIIVAGMAVHYERRLKQRDTHKDDHVYHYPSVIKNADAQYENMRKGREGQSANQGSAADPAYMELKHGDRATYEQIKRP